MNRDRYPDMNMPMGNMMPPRGEAPWGVNTGPPRSEAPWGANVPMKSENMMGAGMKPHMECVDRETVIEDVQLAHAYVPFQKWCPTFMPMTALKKGTIFPGLVNVYGWESRHEMGGDI